MKVLVTGMTSRQTKEDRTVPGMIADLLREDGHEVTVDRPSLAAVLAGETQSEYDWAFVGLGPLHGIGTSYKYGALGVVGSMWDRCTLYLDDVDSGKIGSGLRIMQRHNWKLTKPFYGYCAEYAVASEEKTQRWLLDVIESMLSSSGEAHPPMLVPAFTKDDAFRTAGRVTAGASQKFLRVDWSVMSTSLERDVSAARERYGAADTETPEGAWWSVEAVPEGRAVRSLGPFSWTVQQVGQRELELIYQSDGYLAPGSAWTPRFYQVTQHGIPIVSPWRVFADCIGDAFEELAGTIELMSDEDRAALAERQREQIDAFVMTRDELREIVASTLFTCGPNRVMIDLDETEEKQ